jgi:hypothetical protein
MGVGILAGLKPAASTQASFTVALTNRVGPRMIV